MQNFLTNNIWKILSFLVAIVGAYYLMKADISHLITRVDSVEARTTKIETSQAEFPTKEWFQLKFDILDEKDQEQIKAIRFLEECIK